MLGEVRDVEVGQVDYSHLWFVCGYPLRGATKSTYVMHTPGDGSSHYTFRKKGCMPITIPKQEPIKKVYVEMVRRVVESEADNGENA